MDERLMNSVDHLNAVIDAWEALPGGRRYEGREGARQVDEWLNGTLHPTIDAARNYLGRKPPGAKQQ